jgi:hypothetical protein
MEAKAVPSLCSRPLYNANLSSLSLRVCRCFIDTHLLALQLGCLSPPHA